MGKGGGRGRGKGGCEFCESIHAIACCLCLVLIGGPILIAVGATFITAANRNERARSIDAVQAAVDAWNDPVSPNGWREFRKLVVYAKLTTTGLGCANSTLRLQEDADTRDRFWDAELQFQNVKQLRLTAAVDYGTFIDCFTTVNLTQQVESGNISLTFLPASAKKELDYTIHLDKAGGPKKCSIQKNDGCATTNAYNCRSNCEHYFYGQWKCNGGNYECIVVESYYDSFSVKVSRQVSGVAPGSSSPGFYVDKFNPGSGGGGNILPAGYERRYEYNILPESVNSSDRFQVPNVARQDYTPRQFFITVRSASDPWLTYMAITDGTGYYEVSKSALMLMGTVLLAAGCLSTLMWAVAGFYAWWMLCSQRKPTSRPGGFGGFAWDLANRYGGSYAPALGVPAQVGIQDGIPTAQPIYIYASPQVPRQPSAGFPHYPYAPPYGPSFRYPSPYPQPANGVEVNPVNSGQLAVNYAQPAPIPEAGIPASQAGAPASPLYSFPYETPSFNRPRSVSPAQPASTPPEPPSAAGGDAPAPPPSSAPPAAALN